MPHCIDLIELFRQSPGGVLSSLFCKIRSSELNLASGHFRVKMVLSVPLCEPCSVHTARKDEKKLADNTVGFTDMILAYLEQSVGAPDGPWSWWHASNLAVSLDKFQGLYNQFMDLQKRKLLQGDHCEK